MKPISRSGIAALAFVYAGFAIAADNNEDDKREHRKPPREAVEACAAQVDGDPCSFAGRDGEELAGVCFAPADRMLACRPDSPPPRLRRKDEPPQE